jgi:hypothetical protein
MHACLHAYRVTTERFCHDVLLGPGRRSIEFASDRRFRELFDQRADRA